MRASKPRTSPGVFVIEGGRSPTSCADPTTITSPTTVGGELWPIEPTKETPSRCRWPSKRSTTPPLPKPSTGRPVSASSAARW